MPLRVFIVDDEQPARRKLRRFVEDDPGCTVVGEAGNAKDAVRAIRDERPDLVLLDIQMKGSDGFDVVRNLDRDSLPCIVFVTAHDEYMLQAFDVHAFAYLLKPFDRTRLRRVLDDVKEELNRRRARDTRVADLERLLDEIERRRQAPRTLLVETNERAFFLPIGDIDWIEADRNHARIHCGHAVYTIRSTMDALEQKLDAAKFIRINRSTTVRIDFIRELRKWFHGEYEVALRSGVVVRWTRRYVGRRPDLLGGV